MFAPSVTARSHTVSGGRGNGERAMWFRILGPIEVDGGAGPVRIVAQRQQIILSLTLIEANRIVPVDRLIEAVWDESPPATAKGQVQICVSLLRKQLGDLGLPGVITTAPAGYV